MTPEFLTEDVKNAIANFANIHPNQEVCGLVLLDGSVIESPNTIEGTGVTENGEELTVETGAMIDVDLLMEYDGQIAATFHSHPSEYQEGYLSFTDTQQARLHDIPVLLYHTAFAVWDYYDPNYPHPFPLKEKETSKTNINYYLGWPFIYGRCDCASVLISYFKNHFNHEIPDYFRPYTSEWYMDDSLGNSYLELFQDPINGFTQINTANPKKNDVVLMRFFGSRYPCHVGVMVEDDRMLHLLQPQHLSEVVVWGGAWKRGLHSVWRLASS